jgi:hypothetical protein
VAPDSRRLAAAGPARPGAGAGRRHPGRDGPGRPITDDYLDECTRYRSAPGQGDFDLNGFLRALLATGTTAPVSVEVLSDENDQMPAATVAGALAMATRRVLRAAGVPTRHLRQ